MTAGAGTGRELEPPSGHVRSPGRRVRRFSLGHVAVVAAAALAFVANVAFLRTTDDAVSVVAVARDLPAGHVVTAADLTTADVRVDASVLSTLLTSDDGLVGRVLRTDLAAGSLVGSGDLLAEAAPDGRRAMGLPISPAHAAGGALRTGDVVDVVDVGDDGAARYVVRGAHVVGVADDVGGALSVPGGDHVVLAVEEADVLPIAEAIADGEVDLVVTTGSTDG